MSVFETVIDEPIQQCVTGATISLPFFGYLGGAFFVAHQPGMGFWDGVVWIWYVGRFIAAHFTMLSY
jgi:hypothetical protein